MTPSPFKVLITGATGFLGTQIVRFLLDQSEYDIMVLIRGIDDDNALIRLSRAWWEWPDLLKAVGERIHIVRGDITENELGMESADYQNLAGIITHIIHTAANWSLRASLNELEKTNVQGSLNLLKLAHLAYKNHNLRRFSHISTAYVAGRCEGVISEDSLTDRYGFLSDYEKTKYKAEVEVRNSGLPLSIFRPGMIVGDSNTGYIKTFNTFYAPIRLYLSGKHRILPVDPSTKINIIPVDHVAQAVVKLTFNGDAEGLTFHLTSPYDSLPTVGELIKFLRQWSGEKLDFNLPQPIYAPWLTSFIKKISKSNFIKGSKNLGFLKTIDTLAPYLQEEREFLRDNTDKLLGPSKMSWQEYLPKLLDFAIYMGFFHRSDRTVHEQILFRLKGRGRVMQYYDVVEGDIVGSSSARIHRDILRASASLKKLKIQKGDRVALVGFNSTRYLILDAAIGLVGGISVPLYYTSPLDEIREILEDSKASILFIGTPDILMKFENLETDITIISFSRKPEELPPHIMGWDKFLNLGENANERITAPVSFNDIATIRYTSGTTGKPRGVTFTHGNLRWMAEFIASIPPWKDKNKDASYLSFLPMNHVVEGIMGLYGPYYTPTSLKLYFLENFRDLAEILPQVKPTIFFSVPRLYEKMWSAVSERGISQTYLKSGEGIKKRILRWLIKRELLKKAGLDHCAQLIVGSAPISDDLLYAYHDLGVEIHNAYGLTEAPLITINRLGKNRIGTVGEPLPSTRIRIDEDGEVLVQGPQVTPGYFHDESDGEDSLFKEGWLSTGDFGHLTGDGSLVITGRKKEVIVNSYGKTISPLKAESLLRDIPGISEAMLLGDRKPYCSSLLWLDEDSVGIKEEKIENIHQAIQEINTRVSRPEQIKKWVLLENDLSIERGDLTANLKLKRKNILKRYTSVINSIYENEEPPEYILHLATIGEEK